jgi:trehalose 6-phosphate phosphatase
LTPFGSPYNDDPSRRIRLGRDPYEVPESLAQAVHRRVGGRPLVLLADFDGTLSSLVPEPKEAFIEPVAFAGLAAMATAPQVTLGIVSGRPLDDIRRRVPVPVAYLTGLHGFQIEGPDDRFRHPALDDVPPVIRRVRDRAVPALAWCRGLFLEDKTFALVCDVRLAVPDDAARAVEQFRAIAGPEVERGALRLRVWAHSAELLPPVDWHKGRAVQWIRQRVAAAESSSSAIVYIGDDRTDADAFAALGPGDLAIGVGVRPAVRGLRHRLEGPEAVGRFLAHLAALRGGPR